jgi:hypothetical protein
LLHAIHSPFHWRILKKTILFSGFKDPNKKIREIRKLKSIHDNILQNGKLRVEFPTKTQVCEDLSLCPKTSTKYAVQEFHLCTIGENVLVYFCGIFCCFLLRTQ